MLGWRILQHARLTGLDPIKMQPLREINGAGLALDVDKSSGSLLITKVLANSPAQKAGLLAGQTIRSIDGAPTANKKLADCVEMIRGPAGSRLTLELADAGKGLSNSVELTREKFLLDD
jgi:carboxyl-terminal processing protease